MSNTKLSFKKTLIMNIFFNINFLFYKKFILSICCATLNHWSFDPFASCNFFSNEINKQIMIGQLETTMTLIILVHQFWPIESHYFVKSISREPIPCVIIIWFCFYLLKYINIFLLFILNLSLFYYYLTFI